MKAQTTNKSADFATSSKLQGTEPFPALRRVFGMWCKPYNCLESRSKGTGG